MLNELLNSSTVKDLIRLALKEDLSHGDLTSSLALPERLGGSALVIARQELIVCGLPLVPMVISESHYDIELKELCQEGQMIEADRPILELNGPLQSLLALERLILNFMQRLSGIATLTKRYVDRAGSMKILDTRKTTPGWRLLEKYAVQVGGGVNHRFNLSDMLLVKNNHIDANGGDVSKTLSLILDGKPDQIRLEVEVRTLQELKLSLVFKPDIVMLDNMDNEEISEALEFISQQDFKPEVEVSGGVTLERIASLAKLGVPMVSVGALTTQATNCDISMRISKVGLE